LKQSFEIFIVFDDKCHKPGFLPGFGFSTLIYNHFTKNFSLFDTGGNGIILTHNLKEFNIDFSVLKNVIISHDHHDHAGGLTKILEINPKINIYVPIDNLRSFSKIFPNSQIFGISEMTKIEKNLISSGQIKGSFKSEQSLYLKTKDNGFILLVGCAHPGLEKFIIKARKVSKIRAIIGGFHGFKKLSYLEDIDFIGACHCSKYINSIKETFPMHFRRICVGDNYRF
jgi:7,8-dihydropterin-6-yl-methyl-4-(beta-D-ribofuranosyl)aminobenzene 5'-phosphate synthase